MLISILIYEAIGKFTYITSLASQIRIMEVLPCLFLLVGFVHGGLNQLQIEEFMETPIVPKLKIEMCFMTGMTSRSRPPVHPSYDITIVNCEIGETCTPSNTEIFGNEFG